MLIKRCLDEFQAIDKLLKPKYKLLVLDAMTGKNHYQWPKHLIERLDLIRQCSPNLIVIPVQGQLLHSVMHSKSRLFLWVPVKKWPILNGFTLNGWPAVFLGMGDMTSLVEKANEKIKQSEQDALEKSFQTGQMTLQDFADQMKMMQKLGSLSQIVKYMPGAGNRLIFA